MEIKKTQDSTDNIINADKTQEQWEVVEILKPQEIKRGFGLKSTFQDDDEIKITLHNRDVIVELSFKGITPIFNFSDENAKINCGLVPLFNKYINSLRDGHFIFKVKNSNLMNQLSKESGGLYDYSYGLTHYLIITDEVYYIDIITKEPPTFRTYQYEE